MLHAFPGDALAIVAEDGVLVVAHNAFADVDGRAVGNVVDENVAVGAEGIVLAGLGTAGVGNATAVGREVELLDTAPGAHGALVGFGTDDIDHVAKVDSFVGEGGEEDVGILIHPAVPMTVHEVFVDTTSGLVETGVEFLDIVGASDGDVANVENLVAFGRNLEPFEACIDGGENGFFLRINVHGNDGVATGEEKGFVVEPHGVELVLDSVGDAYGLPVAFDGDEIELGVAFVLLNVVIGVGIDHTRTVGAYGKFAHFTEFPHNLGSETSILDSNLGFADQRDAFLLLFFAADDQ